MAKHLENFGKWYDKYLNLFPFCLDDILIKTVGIAWLFTVEGKWSFIPKIVPTNWQYAAVRAIGVNPPTTPATFPTVPTATWGN